MANKLKIKTIDGLTFKSIAEGAKYYNMTYVAFYYKLKHNLYPFSHIKSVGNKNAKKCIVKGKLYKSQHDAAKATGLNAKVISYRMSRNKPLKPRYGGIPIKISGKGKFKTLTEAAEALNMNYKTFNRKYADIIEVAREEETERLNAEVQNIT